ncbi:MAG: LPS export ABC transporter permease LptG [Hyphomicrobiales bacterium]|nr:LPS export ABC transporter permease LptG [Hyphomicrobiales bacterium]
MSAIARILLPFTTTLGRYIAWRFLRTLLLVFASIFTLIYVIDFVELMRRSSEDADNTAALALISFLRTPAITEKVFPFVVLAASMISLVALTRRLELVVARTAGVSAWQFLLPLAIVALLTGIFSVTIYNPVSTRLKHQADKIETGLTGKSLQPDLEGGVWLRQRSADGQSILRAEKSSDSGTVLATVSVFQYDLDGRFLQRVEAARGRLIEGAWELSQVRINVPGEVPRAEETYLLATNLTRDQVSQSFTNPDAVAFWRLRALAKQTEAAGLNAAPYYLKFQELLARPLLLIAMVFISASFSLRFFRFGGVATAVSGGVASGFVLYVATKLAADLGGAGLLAAPVAAWTPAIVGTMLGVLVLLHQEDG